MTTGVAIVKGLRPGRGEDSFPGLSPVSSLGSMGLGVWWSYSVVENYHKLEWFPFFMVG